MKIFEDLLAEFQLPADVKDRLLRELRKLGYQALADQAARLTAQALLKGIDGVVAAAVKVLPAAEAHDLADWFWQDALEAQLKQLSDALEAYVPLQVAVELAKEQRGPTSVEAAVARVARVEGIANVRAEVRDLLRAATGGDPAD